MNNLVKLPNPRAVKKQAAEWIAALAEGLTEEQTGRLHRWLESDPEHGEVLMRMAAHWDALDSLAELAPTFPLFWHGYRRPRSRLFSRPAIAAAALLGVALAAASSYLLMGRGPVRPGPDVARQSRALPAERVSSAVAAGSAALRTYATPVGKTLSAELADGSVVVLNTDTVVQVGDSAAERHVILKKGEANFRVAHDRSRPFRVQAGVRVVQAVGTMFSVRLGAQQDVQVTVSEGTVKVLNRDAIQPDASTDAEAAGMLVHAGEQALIGESGGHVHHIDVAELQAEEAWQRGLLVYQGEALNSVIADVSRYTTVRFVISDDSIRTRRVGGVFKAGDVTGLLTALNQSFGISAHRAGDVIVLTAEP